MRDEKVPATEMDDARRAVVAGFALSLEHTNQLLDFAEDVKIYNLPADYWDNYPAQISTVSAEDVQRVSRKYIDPATMQIVGVGDAQKIAPVLQKYGPVRVFDAQGKPEEVKPATK
jgi:zinc protease